MFSLKELGQTNAYVNKVVLKPLVARAEVVEIMKSELVQQTCL